MSNEQKGQIALVAGFVILIGFDLLTKAIWFSQFGFKASKLGSIVISCILFSFAFRGAAIARWITVACGAAGLVMGIAWKLYQSDLGIAILVGIVASVTLLCLPVVGTYQAAAKQAQA